MKGGRIFYERALWIVVLCALIPVFYVLSIGPAMMVFERSDFLKQNWNLLMAFYSQIISYAEKNPTQIPAQLLLNYVGFWRRDYSARS